MTNLTALERVTDLMRYTETPGFEGEVEWRIDPNGAWVRFEDVESELARLRTIVRSVNRIISQNEPYRWKVERIVAALGETS